MHNKSNVRGDGVLESLCVAAVQFPFIPVVIHRPETNWLSEPEGGINYWLIGKKIKNDFPHLSSLSIPKYYKDRIEEYLSSDYQDWLVRTVNDILDSIIKTKDDIDIILFPEYSLPLEINNELKNILIDYSDDRCIVGGIGSVCKNAKEDKKNRFVVANNGKLKYGEKIVPNTEELELGIVNGEGPLIYEVSLDHAKEENRTMYVEVLMCSDCIELVKSDSEVQKRLNKEYSKKGIKSDNIAARLIPAFSTKTEDMASISEVVARRFHVISVLANCGFFDGSCIWFPSTEKDVLKHTPEIQGGKSACVIADIPTDFLGRYITTPVGMPTTTTPKTLYKIYPFRFKDRQKGKGFGLDSEGLLSLIAERLSSAISLSGIAFARSPPGGKSSAIIDSSRHWKELQVAINSSTGHSEQPYESFSSSDIIAFYEAMGENDFYILMLNNLYDNLHDDAYKVKVQEIKDHIKEGEGKWLPPPTIWNNEK